MSADTTHGSVERLAAVIVKAVDRETKKRGYTALQACSALGAAAGTLVGVNTPAAADQLMLMCLAAGFTTVVEPAREAHKGQGDGGVVFGADPA